MYDYAASRRSNFAGKEKKKEKEEHLRRKPRNILTSIVSEV